MKITHILFTLVLFSLMTLLPALYMYQTEQFNIWLTIVGVCGFFGTAFMSLIYMVCYIERADFQSMYGVRKDTLVRDEE